MFVIIDYKDTEFPIFEKESGINKLRYKNNQFIQKISNLFIKKL